MVGDTTVPTEVWIRDQLADLVSVLRDDEAQAVLLLRRIFGKVIVL
jgi:hypothetical protein